MKNLNLDCIKSKWVKRLAKMVVLLTVFSGCYMGITGALERISPLLTQASPVPTPSPTPNSPHNSISDNSSKDNSLTAECNGKDPTVEPNGTKYFGSSSASAYGDIAPYFIIGDDCGIKEIIYFVDEKKRLSSTHNCTKSIIYPTNKTGTPQAPDATVVDVYGHTPRTITVSATDCDKTSKTTNKKFRLTYHPDEQSNDKKGHLEPLD